MSEKADSQASNSKQGSSGGCGIIFQGAFLLVVGYFLVSCAATATGIGTKEKPYLPRTYYADVEDVVIEDIEPVIVKTVEGSVFDQNARIAVLDFHSPEQTQGGSLVSDMFASLLRKEKYQVFERDKIQRILDEQQLAFEGRVIQSDLEVAETLGRLETVDYMVFGAVTIYKSKAQSIYLPLYMRQDDREKYKEKYNAYKEWHLNRWFPFPLYFFEPEDEKLKILRHVEDVWSLEELENEYQKVLKHEYRVIATIGISAKIVDVRTGEIVWTGQAETNDFTLVNGTERILNEFLISMVPVESDGE
jgi:curli biogenesis system outer membrane secretion channel CsgG